MNFHAKEIEEILSTLKSSKEGLTSVQVKEKEKEYGLNILPKSKQKTLLSVFFSQFKDLIVIILLITAIVSLCIGEMMDAIFIVIVILSDAILGTFQEWRAEKSAISLQNMVTVKSIVLRDGHKKEIDSKYLVPGDIVCLESGHKIAADMRVIECYNLTIDEAFLTGESMASEKNTDILPTNTPISEQKNMCFAGSTVLTGRAIAVVTSIASNTQLGNIANKVIETEAAKSPLVLRMERFTKQIATVIAIISIILTFILYLKGYAVREIFFIAVALSVSAIPEGLPMSLTIALSIATNKMAKRNVIVRKLNAVEALGSCTVIASDKTGTLTLNEQTVKHIVLADGTTYNVSGDGYNNIGCITPLDDEVILSRIAKNITINNEASLYKENEKWKYNGDAMDVALLSLSAKFKYDYSNLKLLKLIPYESENKYSAATYEDEKNIIGTIKGSVETILDKCTTMYTKNGSIKIDKERILKENENLAKNGYRVLAIASKKLNDKDDELAELEFLALISFQDPIREEAKSAIETCKKAGIKVIIITGDHALTAYAIAKELNIINNLDEVATGDEIEKSLLKGQYVFDNFVSKRKVFARVTPEHKLAIVESLKRNGEFVAVTGDGVNDAPAMRSANIGIAMGSGTDVAKETGEMIITDDSFLSIVAGIEEGRYAYDNIRKVINLLISCGIAEVLFFILSIIANMPMPLVAIQLLWLNLVTDGIQDVALANEAGEIGVMNRKPRDPKESILDKHLIIETLTAGITIGVVIFILWFYLINFKHLPLNHARTYILMAMVFMQNIHAFNCRSEYTSIFKVPIKNNYFIVIGVLIVLALHLIVTQVPYLSHILNTEPLAIKEILSMLLVTIPLLIVSEVYKFYLRKEMRPN